MKSLVALWLLAGVAHAGGGPTVAVMPFKDLSGGKGNVGEAIRETVTTDLKDVAGMRVIERGRIDQVLAEQHLQANKSELDAASTVKVGKLLGASLIVTGAYQRASSSVRLTARFVKVETGEVTGTAKVDGGASDFLHLQDKITVELLKSAGIESKQVQRFTQRARPKLKSMKPIELYGDAVVETDEGKKKLLLVAALNEDPTFVYATRDLDALEQRLKAYDKNVRIEQDKAIKELQQAIGNEKDPQAYLKVSQLLGALTMQRRYRTLRTVGQALSQSKVAVPVGATPLTEMAQYYIAFGEMQMYEDDNFLRDGEKFLAKYPASSFAPGLRTMMEQVIERKRQAFEGEQEVATAVNQLDAKARADLCRVAAVYNEHHQYREARRLFDACLAQGNSIFPRPVALQVAIVVCQQMGDFTNARRYMSILEKEDPKSYNTMKGFMMTWPAD